MSSWADKIDGCLRGTLDHGRLLDENGNPIQGWVEYDGQWFYGDDALGTLHTGWGYIGGAWYYFNEDGTVTYGWKQIDGSWYYFQSDGTAIYGWKNIDGDWYYFDSHAMATYGWQNIGDRWYYFDEHARMVTGWHRIAGSEYYFDSGGVYVPASNEMYYVAQRFSSATSWLILVDRSACKVAVFHGSYGNWHVEKIWDCTLGAPNTPTITGTYSTKYRYDALPSTPAAKYATNIVGGYFFHSILNSTSELGHWLSHGCIRLHWDNARWIYQNIPLGTTVHIY